MMKQEAKVSRTEERISLPPAPVPANLSFSPAPVPISEISRQRLAELDPSGTYGIPNGLGPFPSLSGRRIVMVDDSLDTLVVFAPHIVAATAGNGFFVHYKSGDSIAKLGTEILKHKPDLVLLDWNLDLRASPPMTGDIVGDRLSRLGAKIILFSSEKLRDFLIRDARALGSVVKRVSEPQVSLTELDNLAARLGL